MKTLRFEGKGFEYFKIWMVNILLTIVTLGLYYPWAKVRHLRYFYGVRNCFCLAYCLCRYSAGIAYRGLVGCYSIVRSGALGYLAQHDVWYAHDKL
ncbi:MAG: hypothetical protein ACJAUP_000857 [Cellvibrionaceae bacterium]|jgi:hypothetical protein